MPKCHMCDKPPKWVVYTSYDVTPHVVHPILARHAMPMIRACDKHLTAFLNKDHDTPKSTKQWVIKPERRFA